MPLYYQTGERVRVIDPADRRKRVNGLIMDKNEGRGASEYLILLDGDTEPMSFDKDEVTGRAN